MTDPPDLSTYQFHRKEWSSYDELRREFDWNTPEQFNIAEYVCDRWAGEDRVAILGESADGTEEVYTFADLDRATNRLANWLVRHGVTPGDWVGLNTPQRPETPIAHIAVWKTGAGTVPLSTLFGPDALRYRLSETGAKLCIVDESNVDAFREVKADLDDLETTVTVGDVAPRTDELDFWNAIEAESDDFEAVQTAPEDDATIIYTSGTTGKPKGVRHVHRVLLGHLPPFLTMVCNLEIDDASVFWKPAEWAWATIFDGMLPPLYYGRPIVAYNGGAFDPERTFELIEKYAVTNFSVPPTALRMLSEVDSPGERYDLSSMRVIQSGGEALGEPVVDWATTTFENTTVHEAYGQTEANLLVGDCTKLAEGHPDKVGRPGPGFDVRIVDPETGRPTVEPGEIGEIAVRYENNPICFTEYWHRPEATEAKVQNGWLLTEDLGAMDDDGYVTFKSRKDDVIISAGYRIGPEEVEECIADHPKIADSAVIGVPDQERGEVPKAFVILTEGETADGISQQVKQHVKDRLAKYEYPREIEIVADLPKTTTGKVDRSALKDREGLGD